MRIALITPHATPPGLVGTSGGGPRVVPLAQALAELGHDITVYARKDSPSLPATIKASPRVTIEHVPAGPAKRMGTDDVAPHAGQLGDQLARRWRKSPPDVAHAYSWPSGLAALAAARDLGVPVVQTFHSLTSPVRGDGLRESRESMARLRLKVCLARNVQAVLARSSGEMRELARLGVPRASMRVVPWGVDTAYFVPEGPAARRNGQPRLLAVGPMTEHRRLDIIFRALADVPGAELLLACAPMPGQPDGDRLHRALSRLAGKLRVSDRVSFAGETSWEDLPALLRSADVLVSAAWDSLFDAAALQAMACGTPVVAPAVGFYADSVIDGTTGMLVPPGQPAILARRIRRLLSSPLHLDAFGIAAADRARSRYSWDRIARETVKAYERFHPVPAPEEEDELEPELELTEALA
ncbi:MAG TPA: glycosyltransferase [Streptosporangiaceae bacterium]